MIRRIRELLYDQGFTIHGARNQMQEMGQVHRSQKRSNGADDSELQIHASKNGLTQEPAISDEQALEDALSAAMAASMPTAASKSTANNSNFKWQFVRQELNEIRELLSSSSQALQV